ncbi:hypothetical protein HispidOSU_031219, partial [Sigmodon hispidus]
MPWLSRETGPPEEGTSHADLPPPEHMKSLLTDKDSLSGSQAKGPEISAAAFPHHTIMKMLEDVTDRTQSSGFSVKSTM